MNKNKAKRYTRVINGWTKSSHKGAIIYFREKEQWKRKLKKEKGLEETKEK